MSTRAKVVGATLSAGIVLGTWYVGNQGAGVVFNPGAEHDASNAAPSQSKAQPGAGAEPGTQTDGQASPGAEPGASTQVTGSFTGDNVSNRYGTVQVTVALEQGKIADVTAKTTVREQESQRFVNRAVPVLREAVIAANSAQVQMVSGATYTSESYLTSLQSALDQAGL